VNLMSEICVTLSLRRHQGEVFLCEKRFVVLVAGRRWGKTTLAIWWLIVDACSNNNRMCYYVAPTYGQAKRIAWSILKQMIPPSARSRISEQELLIEFPNGSVIQLHGADRPDRLRGVGLDCAVLDEFADMKSETWNSVIRPVLSDRKGRALFLGTPRGRDHLYDLYCRGKFRQDWATFHFSTAQGGYVSDDELATVGGDMDPHEYAREFGASFEDSRVRVYHGFDLDKNVIELTRSPHASLLVGMDFNVSPMTAVVGQRVAEQCHIIDEIVLKNSNTQEMMLELNHRYGGCKGIVHPDPSAASRKTSSPAGETDLTLIERAGWPVYRSSPYKVIDRINSVNAMLLNAQGSRRLLISPKCKHLIKALDCLAYREGTKIPDKRSGFDHITDALGYLIIGVFPIITDSVSVNPVSI
jgi:Terminase large subunit, T4likevirus-type, N-terminal